MTLSLGLIRDKNKQDRSEYCEGLKPHTHSENQLPNKSLDRLVKPQLLDELLARENDSNESTRQPINDAAKLLLKHTNIETDSNSDDRSILDKRCS